MVFNSRVKPAVLAMIIVAVTPLGLLAQSIPDRQSALTMNRWEPPVRVVQEIEPSAFAESRNHFMRVQYVEPDGPGSVGAAAPESRSAVGVAMEGDPMPLLHSHQVIQAPRIVQPGHSHPHADLRPDTMANPVHPLPHLIGHHADQPTPAVIPDAIHREVWKSPFSYGYFGASGSRRWIRHYGYRDRDKEWRLR